MPIAGIVDGNVDRTDLALDPRDDGSRPLLRDIQMDIVTRYLLIAVLAMGFARSGSLRKTSNAMALDYARFPGGTGVVIP